STRACVRSRARNGARTGVAARSGWRSECPRLACDLMILAGDVGGTKTDFALFDPAGSPRSPQHELVARSREHASFDELLLEFVRTSGAHPTRVVLGIAGPIVDNRCEATNLPWTIDGRSLGRALGGAHVTLLNDLEATGWGIATLDAKDLRTLQPGAPEPGNRALIAAG